MTTAWNDGVAAVLRLAAAATLSCVLSACSMNMFGGGPDLSTSVAAANASASPAQIAAGQATALPAIATECPPIKVRDGGEVLLNYGGARSGTPQTLHYQAGLEKETRNCVVSNGLITVKMGVIGRVLLGPAGKEASVNLPLRFTVERNGMSVFSEKYSVPVQISAATQTGEFVKVVDNVAIPYLGGETIVIYVGFDNGK